MIINDHGSCLGKLRELIDDNDDDEQQAEPAHRQKLDGTFPLGTQIVSVHII